MKVGDIFRTLHVFRGAFIEDSVVMITKINKNMVSYMYLDTVEIIGESFNSFSQHIENFKDGTIPLTDLTKTLV